MEFANEIKNTTELDIAFIEYDKTSKKPDDLKQKANEINADYVLYSRNEQTSGAKIGRITSYLQLGYSSFSGIDSLEWKQQTKVCLKDFVKKPVALEYTRPTTISDTHKNTATSTFSLVFDVEQLGGVRFGLPRILDLLAKHKISATFFTTNLMLEVYSNLEELLVKNGHEIGLHGLYHEPLDNKPFYEQKEYVGEMVRKIKTKVSGANFIGRMNIETLKALTETKINYFVTPLKNTKKIFSAYADPMLVKTEKSNLWLAPIFVETYNKTWEQVQQQVENTLGANTQPKHITILMHPFYDGSLERIKILEKLVQLLLLKQLTPMRLDQKINTLKTYEPNQLYSWRLNQEKTGKIWFLKQRIENNYCAKRYHKASLNNQKPGIKIM